jgi:hypothetical protein
MGVNPRCISTQQAGDDCDLEEIFCGKYIGKVSWLNNDSIAEFHVIQLTKIEFAYVPMCNGENLNKNQQQLFGSIFLLFARVIFQMQRAQGDTALREKLTKFFQEWILVGNH